MAENTDQKVNPIQVQKFLKGVDYPISKDKLIEKAKNEGADDAVIKTLQQMKMSNYNSPNDVAQAIGEI